MKTVVFGEFVRHTFLALFLLSWYFLSVAGFCNYSTRTFPNVQLVSWHLVFWWVTFQIRRLQRWLMLPTHYLAA